MKISEEKLELFFTVTNPLFWIMVITYLIWDAIIHPVWDYIGLEGWYNTYFRINMKDYSNGMKAAIELCEAHALDGKTWYTRWRHGLYAEKIRSIQKSITKQ